MFSISLIDVQTGEIVSGLEGGRPMDAGLLGGLAIRAIPVPSERTDFHEVEGVRFTLSLNENDIAAETVTSDPFIFGNLEGVANGTAKLMVEALDADGEPLANGSQEIIFEVAEMTPEESTEFSPIHLQTIDDSLEGGEILIATNESNGSTANTAGGAYVDYDSFSGESINITAEDNVYQAEVTATNGELSTVETLEVSAGDVEEDAFAPIIIQAENAVLVDINDSGVPTDGAFTRVVGADNPDAYGNYREGAEGGAYIDFGTDPGDEVVFGIDAEVAGTYTATIRFANGGTEARPLNVMVNGGAETLVAFPATPDDGVTDPWDAWNELTIEVDLQAGANTVSFAIPTASEGGLDNGPNIDQIVFDYNEGSETPVEPFLFEIEGEALTIDDTEPTPDTVVRDPSNPEANEGGGSDGLWDGYSGTGYLDMGGEAGDAAFFDVSVEETGTYTLTVRYTNGSSDQEGRPMTVLVGGFEQGEIPFVGTGSDANGWQNWTEATLEVQLEAGSNTIRLENVGNAGPNIDKLTVSRDGEEPPFIEPGERFKVKINFQPEGFATPDGYVADTGLAFGEQSVEVGGQAYQYGWVSEASIADGTENGTTPMAINEQSSVAVNDRTDEIAGLDPRQGTYAHFDQPAAGYERAGWEIELDDGYYEVTIAIGDTSGPYDSHNVLNAEGELFNDPFTPFRPDDFPTDSDPSNDTEGFRSDLVTRIVQVTDGRLTLDSIGLGNENTELQYIEIQALPDLTPDDVREAPEDYAFFTDPRAIAGVGENEVEVDLDPESDSAPIGVDPTSDIFLGISVVDSRGGALLESLDDGSIRLFETVSGQEVAFNANTTGGFDSLTISPTGELKEFTSYTLVIEGFQDRGENDDPSAPTREFQKFTTTFVTGEAPEVVAREVAFNDVVELNGAEDGAFQFTSIELSPDGSKMYISTMLGEIKRYDVDPQTGALSNEQVLSLDYFDGDSAGPRGIIGLTFDPNDSNVLWVTDNYPIPLSGRDNGVPDFSGRISKITIDEGEAFNATAESYVTGLPRSNGDHVTNSLEFRVNPDYDAVTNPDVPTHLLYLVQGSNSAMGEPDSAWGNRPERLLNATVLEIDPTRDAPEGGFNVATEPLPDDGFNRRYTDDDGADFKADPIAMGNGQFLVFAPNGTATVEDQDGNVIETFYDPFAEDAVVKIFATGVRNAYDLVWHSNGQLYVPANGSAAGGSVPDNPETPEDELHTNVGNQDDYLFKVEEGGYYGHPNPLRDEYILNGGNPTSGSDPNQVGDYPAGTDPEESYDLEGAYSLGENRSPNGVTEYTSGVFGGDLQGSVLFTEYSGGNDIRSITLDANGNIVGDDVLRDVNGSVITYIDPLDIIENPATGQLYLLTLNRNNGQSQIVRLDPAPGGVITDPDGPGEPDDGLVSLLVIQAEDDSPSDGTSATIAEGGGAEIQIRNADNPESEPGLPNGLRPGAYGNDGNNDNTDGVLGGYADFGATNADFLTFSFELSGAQAGDSVLRVRYANGGTMDRPLEVFVNNISVGIFDFAPPTGVAGNDAWSEWLTLDIPADLVSGSNTVRFQTTANAGPNIDQMEILQQPEDIDTDIAIQSGDAAYYADRLHFSYLESDSASNPDRDYKESGMVVISNTGSNELAITDVDIDGPFELAVPDIFDGLTLATGESIEVEVLFDREAYTPPTTDAGDGVFEGVLRLTTNDADAPVAEVHLAGFWQARDEGGWEPNVNEVWEVFGFGNRIDGLSTVGGGENSALSDYDLYRPVNDDEVLSRYWTIAEGHESAKITQLAAFHGSGGAALGIHNPQNKGQDIQLSNHAGDNNQSLLPITSNGQFATATFTRDQIPDSWLGNGMFGIEVAGLSTDPSLNPTGGGDVPDDAEGIERGYTVRMFQALDANGNVIPNTYLGIMDYTGINYDYNDNMFVIEGIAPASGDELSIANLDGVLSDERLEISSLETGNSIALDVLASGGDGESIAYSDAEPDQLGSDYRELEVGIVGDGEAVGWVDDGEWVEYAIEVEQAGTYDLSFVTASPNDGRTITAAVEHEGALYAQSAPLEVPNSSQWGNYVATSTLALDLQEGEQVLRLTFNGGSMNLQSLTIEKQASATSQSLASSLGGILSGDEPEQIGDEAIIAMSDDVSLAGLADDAGESSMMYQ